MPLLFVRLFHRRRRRCVVVVIVVVTARDCKIQFTMYIICCMLNSYPRFYTPTVQMMYICAMVSMCALILGSSVCTDNIHRVWNLTHFYMDMEEYNIIIIYVGSTDWCDGVGVFHLDCWLFTESILVSANVQWFKLASEHTVCCKRQNNILL